MEIGRVRIDGVGVHPLDKEGLLSWVDVRIAAARAGRAAGALVMYSNVHVLNTAARDEELRAWLNAADLNYCDGAGVRLGGRLLGLDLPERMTGADWIWDLAARAEGRWRLYWLGGAPGVTERAAALLSRRYPRLQIASDHGFHPRTGPEHEEELKRIEAFDPDILLVGMGTPVQERWAVAARSRLRVPVIWVLGATADFVSGEVSRGPALLFRHQEWLARLMVDPRRLWRRYLLGNPAFLSRVLVERLRNTTRAEP